MAQSEWADLTYGPKRDVVGHGLVVEDRDKAPRHRRYLIEERLSCGHTVLKGTSGHGYQPANTRNCAKCRGK